MPGLFVVSRVPGIGFISESALGCSSEDWIGDEILRWEAEGWLLPLIPVRWMGVALTYLASLCAILALAAEVLFLLSTIFVIMN